MSQIGKSPHVSLRRPPALIWQDCASQIGIRKLRTFKVCPCQIYLFEVCINEIGMSKISIIKTCKSQVCSIEICITQSCIH